MRGRGHDIEREAGDDVLAPHHNCLTIKPQKWEGDEKIETPERMNSSRFLRRSLADWPTHVHATVAERERPRGDHVIL